MTKITYTVKDDEFILTCVGHAGYAKAGEDIVCAGISTLVQTLANYLPQVTDVYDVAISKAKVFCYGKGEEAYTCFKMTLAGLRLMETEFPLYLEVAEGCTINSQNPLQ